MSNNSLLVQFFVKEVFKNDAYEAEELTYLISSDFSYYLDVGYRMDYGQFIEQIKFLFTSTTVKLASIASDDDIHFYCDFEVNLPEPADERHKYGLAQIVVDKGFIHQVTINYHKNKKEFIEFKKFTPALL